MFKSPFDARSRNTAPFLNLALTEDSEQGTRPVYPAQDYRTSSGRSTGVKYKSSKLVDQIEEREESRVVRDEGSPDKLSISCPPNHLLLPKNISSIRAHPAQGVKAGVESVEGDWRRQLHNRTYVALDRPVTPAPWSPANSYKVERRTTVRYPAYQDTILGESSSVARSVESPTASLSSPYMPSPKESREHHKKKSHPSSARKRGIPRPRPDLISNYFVASSTIPAIPQSFEPIVEFDNEVESVYSPPKWERSAPQSSKQNDRSQRSATQSTTFHNLSTNSPTRGRPPPLLPPIKADVRTTLVNGIGEHSESPERLHFEDVPFLPSRPSTPPTESPDPPYSPDSYSFWPSRPGTPTPLSPQNAYANGSGRQSARGFRTSSPRPEAMESLQRLVLSPTRPSRTIIDEKSMEINEKVSTVFAEEEDESRSPVQEIFPSELLRPAESDRVCISGPLPRSGAPLQNMAPTIHTLPFLAIHPLLLTSEDLDDYVLLSAAAYRSSRVFFNKVDGVPPRIINICVYLMGIFRDLPKYRIFLSYRDIEAQSLLNVLQTLLDHSHLEEQFRLILFVALVRLSRKSMLYPQSFIVSDVTIQGQFAVTEGSFGQIFKAVSRGRLVCLKLVKMYDRSDQAQLDKAFCREAVVWGQLSHDNILPFYGIHRTNDARQRIGLLSPWMKNGNINEYLTLHPDINRSHLILDVASGLLYLHNNGVIHGDLKGANILISDSGRACLADLGLSCVRDANGLKTASLSSNPEGGAARFQAPELFHPEIESPIRTKASDVYAFSLVCYEIFMGHPPFPEIKLNYTVMLRVGQGERPSKPLDPSHEARGLTCEMWTLMEECWNHIPEKRPETAQIVARLPRGTSVDKRNSGGWGELSPSRFRESDIYSTNDGDHIRR